MSIESRAAVVCPPTLVVAAARGAFREHADRTTVGASLVLDTIRDEVSGDCARRLLMVAGETFDLVLTVTRTPRGNAIGGAFLFDAARGVHSETRAVGIRRPLRATIVLSADRNGVLCETVIPAGPACVIVRDAAGDTYHSNWLTL